MTRFWIRVNARLADDADVRAFAFMLFPKAPAWLAVRTTCGLLVSLWGRVIDEQEDGDLSDRDDYALEEWAGWGGKRGLFAREFRARFTADGKIREWDEYQGTLITRRENDRERKRLKKEADDRRKADEEVGRNSAGKDAESRKNSSRNGKGNDQSLPSAPYSAEGEETTTDSAPAPEGAAPPAAHNGDSHITPAAREALNRRGIRDEQIDAAPRGNIADHNADLAWRQSQYEAELKAAADRWMRENPDETAEIGEEKRLERGYPTGKSASDLTATKVEILRGAVHEEIRRRNEWPTLDAWDGSEFKTPASA